MDIYLDTREQDGKTIIQARAHIRLKKGFKEYRTWLDDEQLEVKNPASDSDAWDHARENALYAIKNILIEDGYDEKQVKGNINRWHRQNVPDIV